MEDRSKDEHYDDDSIQLHLRLDALEPSFNIQDFLTSNGVAHSHIADHDWQQFASYQSPSTWPLRQKAAVLLAPFAASTLAAYAAGAYALASEPLRELWNITATEYNAGITLFVAGFGFAPIILAPVSEAYGRYWVFVGAGIVFFFGTLGCAFSSSYPSMLISRLITGSGASVYATLTGGVVSDLFKREELNTPMALYSLTIMIGTGLGPLVSGLAVTYLSWKWIFYLQLIFIGLTTLCIACFFSETRGNVILARKCTALNDFDGLSALVASPDSTLSSSSFPSLTPRPVIFRPETKQYNFSIRTILRSFGFPLKLLATESIVFWFSVWVSFAWAILYMQFVSIGIVFRATYNFDNARVGVVYVFVIGGSVLGMVTSILGDRGLSRFRPRSMDSPEGLLQSACVQSIFLPLGLFWFGWTADSNVPWVVPGLAIGSCTMGIFSIYLAVFNYLASTYQLYSSSAQAAQSMCRNLIAGVFPLFTHLMLENLGFSGAGSLLGGLGLILTGVPWLLYFFGKKIRARSPFAGQLSDISPK